MADVPPELFPVFRHLARDLDLFDGDVAMVAGWAFHESAGLHVYAVRYEPAFYERYVPQETKDSDPTEARCRAMSWGLFQVMGQVARERGFDGRFLPELCDPETNARVAAEHLLWGKARGDGSWEQALAAYNGGLGGNREPPYRRQSYVDTVREAGEWFRPNGRCVE